MLAIGPNDDLIAQFESMKLKHKIAFMVFKVDKQPNGKGEEITIEKSVLKEEVADKDYRSAFIDAVKDSGTCRFACVDWNNKLLFVGWSPEAAKGKDKMVYASIKEAFINSLVGIQIKIQCTDDSELCAEEIAKKCASNV
eukprot:139525_1